MPASKQIVIEVRSRKRKEVDNEEAVMGGRIGDREASKDWFRGRRIKAEQ